MGRRDEFSFASLAEEVMGEVQNEINKQYDEFLYRKPLKQTKKTQDKTCVFFGLN